MRKITCRVHYLEEAEFFLDSLPIKAYRKIAFNVGKIRDGFADSEIFKKLEGTEIWEIRTLYDGLAYRLFAFWDTRRETLIVATHGIVKKTDKTPRNEIAKAERMRKDYFNDRSHTWHG